MVFRIRREKPRIDQDDIDDICLRAIRHDGKKMDHPITLVVNYKRKDTKY